ncbi:MAG: sodium/proline symporter [Oligoflexales bacterium]|nr:sodium/proline symporter [Oligoflexales bacterium]
MENLITILIYTGIIIGISYLAKLKAKSHADFIIGGRKNSGPMTALAAGTSDMSNWLMMSLPALVFVQGLRSIWLPIALFLGAYANWIFVAPRLRSFTASLDSLTLPDYFSKRLGQQGHGIKALLAVSIGIFFTLYAGASFLGGAMLCEHLFGLSYMHALILCSSFVLVYTILGGFVAVTWIDFFQGILMFIAILAVPIFTFFSFKSELHPVTINLSEKYFDIFHDFSWIHMLSCVAWGFGYFGQFHIAVRFMAIRSLDELPAARRICSTWMFFALLGAVFIGVGAKFYYEGATLAKPEMLFMKLSSEVFNPWVAAWMFSAVLSAIMSSASAQLLLAASSLTEDILAPLLPATLCKHQTKLSRLGLILVSAISFFIAFNPKSSIFDYVGIAWAGIGASFGPLMLFSLFWGKLTYKGGLYGVLAGSVTVFMTEAVIRLGNFPDALSGLSLIPGFISSCLVIVFKSSQDIRRGHGDGEMSIFKEIAMSYKQK